MQMRLIFFTLFVLLFSAAAFASPAAQGVVDQERKWIEEYAKIYRSSKNLSYNYREIESRLKNKHSLFSYFLPEVFAEDTGLNSDLWGWDELPPIPSPTALLQVGDTASAGGWMISKVGKAIKIPGAGVVKAVAGRATAALAGGVFVDWAAYKVEAYMAPSCDKQVEELRGILEQEKLALKSLDCEWYDRTNLTMARDANGWLVDSGLLKFDKSSLDQGKKINESYDKYVGIQDENRSIELWGQNGRSEKFWVDFTKGLAWTHPNAVYIFGADDFKEVRALVPGKNSSEVQRISKKTGDKGFENDKNYIEPYRKIFHYIGENRSCYKCQAQFLKPYGEGGLLDSSFPERLKGSSSSKKSSAAGQNKH
jgi:hypothetical protein